MKFIFALTLLLSTFTFVAFASTPTAYSQNEGEPKFKSTTIDYGTIKKGANGVREFEFTNNSSKPIIITNCQGSCGCTVPECPKQPILPGQTVKIPVKYDTQRLGLFTKNVTVTTDSEKFPTFSLTIKGNVEE